MLADGTILELVLIDGIRAARIHCPPEIVPAPGQYLMAHVDRSDAPLATVLFRTKSFVTPEDRDGTVFMAASPVPAHWMPGTRIHLRGPLGHGFSIPVTARRIALISWKSPNFDARGSCSRLLSLLDPAIKQGASVALVCDIAPEDLPLQVEVQPMRALPDVAIWADYIACDIPRDSLTLLKHKLSNVAAVVQVIVDVPMPCGGLAQCGICTIELQSGSLLACDDGPVFDLAQLKR